MKQRLYIIFHEVFQYSLITYLVLTLIESMKEGFVSNFFNSNILLIPLLISGILMAYLRHANVPSDTQSKITNEDVQNILIFAISGTILVYFKIQDMGTISLYIAIAAGIIILLVSILLLINQ